MRQQNNSKLFVDTSAECMIQFVLL